MPKSSQSVCKRTRSKSKQTSLLDFDVPKKRRAAPMTSSAVAASTERESSGVQAGGNVSSWPTTSFDERSRAPASAERPSQEETTQDRGGTAAKETATKETAAAAKRTGAGKLNVQLYAPKLSNKRRRVGNATNTISKSATTAAAAANEKKPLASVAHLDNLPVAKKKRSATVFYDVITAKRIDEESSEKRVAVKNTLEIQQEGLGCSVKTSEGRWIEQQHQPSSVTPSPDPPARKEASEKNADDVLEAGVNHDNICGVSSDVNNAVTMEPLAAGNSDGVSIDERNSVVSTPLEANDERKKAGNENGTKNVISKEVVAKKKPTLWANRWVTIDPIDVSLTRSQQSLLPNQLRQSQSQSTVPAFHYAWMQPYQPAVIACHTDAKRSTTENALPAGVKDIDLLPHVCCAHSIHSHAGYSWISSKRRCGCAKDANHCSGEAITEVYLGVYGAERYGDVGMAGLGKGEEGAVNDMDWRAEVWWLDQTRKEMKMRVKNDVKKNSTSPPLKNLDSITTLFDVMKPKTKSGCSKLDSPGERRSRTPSPTSTMSNASFISNTPLSSLSSSGTQTMTIPTSVAEHLDYLPRQPHITVEMRKILVDWLSEVAEEYKLSTEAFWLSVTLVDRSLACSYGDDRKNGKNPEKRGIGDGNMIVQKDKLQLLGCACTLIASKIVEITPPTADDFVYISDKTYTRKEILEMEARVCDALKFSLSFRTPYYHVDRFLRASHASSESSCSSPSSLLSFVPNCVNNATNSLLKRLVFYLLDLAALEYKLVSKRPALVTAGAVYLARATLGIREPPLAADSSIRRDTTLGFWSKTLEYYTGYDLWDLEETVRILHRLHSASEGSNLTSTYSKHRSNKYKRVALKTVLNECELGFL